jgi:DNA gyrase subunit A
MLSEYIKFQLEVVTRRTQFDLKKAQERAHILDGIKIAIDFIEEVIAILRRSKSINEGKTALMERFGLDEIQAQAIVAMRLGQLTGLEREKIEEELAALHVKIADYQLILSDEGRILGIIKDEATAIRNKYGDERRTQIETISGEVDVEDLIPVEDCVITLTHFGYIKRQPVSAYRIQRRGGRGISGLSRREEDFVEELFVCSTHDYVLFFTNLGRVYRLKGYELPEGSRTSKGTNIVNLLPITQEEKITAMIRVPKFEENMYLVMVTRSGIIKRTALEEYDTARKGGVIGILLDDDDELVRVRLTDGKTQLIVGTKKGWAIRFDETNARPMGRAAHGVKAIRLDSDDNVVSMSVVREGGTLLSVTENGFGKRVELDEYHNQHRGGKGLISYNVNEKTGDIAGMIIVDETEDAMLISSDGVIIRINVKEIPVYSRYARGVHVMRLDEGTRLVTVASSPHVEDAVENVDAVDNIEALENIDAAEINDQTEIVGSEDGIDE